nr:immunoglobulin heavy chain junction region [Macaca mulatta]MOV90720.1 immunoglobulin heavy chain junction region [Macaca mulatta]
CVKDFQWLVDLYW